MSFGERNKTKENKLKSHFGNLYKKRFTSCDRVCVLLMGKKALEREREIVE